MSVLKVAGAAVAVLVLVSTQALSMTVTNRDTKEYTVVIQKGDNETEHALPAGGTVEDACDEGCQVRIAGIEGEVSAQTADRYVIQDGALQREQE